MRKCSYEDMDIDSNDSMSRCKIVTTTFLLHLSLHLSARRDIIDPVGSTCSIVYPFATSRSLKKVVQDFQICTTLISSSRDMYKANCRPEPYASELSRAGLEGDQLKILPSLLLPRSRAKFCLAFSCASLKPSHASGSCSCSCLKSS